MKYLKINKFLNSNNISQFDCWTVFLIRCSIKKLFWTVMYEPNIWHGEITAICFLRASGVFLPCSKSSGMHESKRPWMKSHWSLERRSKPLVCRIILVDSCFLFLLVVVSGNICFLVSLQSKMWCISVLSLELWPAHSQSQTTNSTLSV